MRVNGANGLGGLVALVLGSGGLALFLAEIVKAVVRGGDRRVESIARREEHLDEAANRITGMWEADNVRLRQELGEIRNRIALLESDLRLALDDLAMAIAHGRALRRHLPDDHMDGTAFDRFVAHLARGRTPAEMQAALRRIDENDAR